MKKTQKFTIVLAIITALMCIGFLSTSSVYAETALEGYDYDGDTGTIKLTSDITFGKVWEIAEDASYVLDLNGYTLTASSEDPFFSVAGTLTITDSSSEGTGKIEATGKIYVSGSLIINGGNISMSNGYGIYLDNGYAEVNGGVVTSKYAVVSCNNTTGSMTLVVNGGTLTSETGISIYMAGPYGVTVNGGTLNGGIALRMGYVTINGGTINANTGEILDMADWYNKSGYAWCGDAIFVYAGTYTTNVENASTNYEININGGKINVMNDSGNAVTIYELGKVDQTGTVTITGGTFNVQNGEAVKVLTLEDIGVTEPAKGYGNKNINNTTSVTGGTYTKTDIIDEYDPDTYMLLNNEDGTYTIVLRASYDESVYDITTNEDGSVTVTEKDADYTEVEKAIAKAKALNSSDYTEGSWADLQQAIANVVYGLKISDQDTVDFYVWAIQDALDNLVKVDEEEQTEEPQDNEEGEQLEEDTINPKTGDMIILFGSILLIAVAGLIITIKIRKKANK